MNPLRDGSHQLSTPLSLLMVEARVLVTGAFGLVGPYLTRAFHQRGWSVTTLSRSRGDLQVDLGRDADLRTIIGPRVDAVVNCVALTDVDACEREPERAWVANAAVVANLVRNVPLTCQFVQISTDQVYGRSGGHHAESAVSPVNAYGRTKVAGEMACLGHPAATVIRTNVFGPSLVPYRKSLSDWVLHQLAAGELVEGFRDLEFTPVHLSTLADIVTYVVTERLMGTFNVGSRGSLSKFDFARAVCRQYGFDEDRVVPTMSTDRPGRAARPADTSLDVSLFERMTGIELPDLTEEIKRL